MPLPQFVTYSERGGSHVENEDVVLAQPHPRNETLLLCTLADGQGGRSGGAIAAQTASATVLSQASALVPSRLQNPLTRQRAWVSVLVHADEVVSETSSGGFTTLIGLAVGANFVAGASCGDSGVLLVRGAAGGGKAEWLTENQRKNPPVGSGAAHPVAFSAHLHPGDVFLVMSDGAFRYVGEDALRQVCHNNGPETIAAALRELQAAQSRSDELSDDFSVIVVRR